MIDPGKHKMKKTLPIFAAIISSSTNKGACHEIVADLFFQQFRDHLYLCVLGGQWNNEKGTVCYPDSSVEAELPL